jgi:DNA-binding NtrC family response regulator
LRLLETRTYKKLGETRVRKANVRFVAATHVDLRRLVNAGAFREDLYFRLAVATLSLPPLRDRAEDLELLIEEFARDLPPHLSRHALVDEAKRRMWPGNVRELRSFVLRAIALGAVDEPPVDASGVDLSRPFKEVQAACLERLEREYVGALMKRHARNVTQVARAAGLDRTYIHRLIKKHGL